MVSLKHSTRLRSGDEIIAAGDVNDKRFASISGGGFGDCNPAGDMPDGLSTVKDNGEDTDNTDLMYLFILLSGGHSISFLFFSSSVRINRLSSAPGISIVQRSLLCSPIVLAREAISK